MYYGFKKYRLSCNCRMCDNPPPRGLLQTPAASLLPGHSRSRSVRMLLWTAQGSNRAPRRSLQTSKDRHLEPV
ncbi:hypothetical protein L596_023003 [Steinernema carpocapsae]|uniref:Uncharacterized protein n=1 Tax=Steinernema carpocapsae TaxID=34508 RepID=A0A4U5MCA3_STECR|nr:hypothetical protein L596_023003 [Steinernema carpocapsae]